MSKPGSDGWRQAVDRVVQRTSTKISAAIDQMIVDLPEGAAPQMAIELVVRELVGRQFRIMSLIMEDRDIREAYAAAVAELPATARPKGPPPRER